MEPITCPHPTCGHEWTPRKENPKKCPQCQNPLWRSPRPKKRKLGYEDLTAADIDRVFEKPRTMTMDELRPHLEAPDLVPTPEPECVRAPEENDSLSARKAKAEELMRQLA